MLMKTIVIYTSQTGFTKRYAEWIAEATGLTALNYRLQKRKIWLHMKQLFLEVGLVRAVSVKLAGLREI